jgi:hypothetical protein
MLKKKFPKLDLQVITSELPDELRKQRIEEMGITHRASADCHRLPVRRHQPARALHRRSALRPAVEPQPPGTARRPRRSLRQNAPEVKACLLYGADNPIDGIVLDVLLRKVREIKRATGINVPFPEDSQSIIDTITQALLLNPNRQIERKRIGKNQIEFDFGDFDEATTAKANITRKVDEAAEREKASRSIFAQNAIKAHEIEADLREVDEAIGDPQVRRILRHLVTEQPARRAGPQQGCQNTAITSRQPAAATARPASLPATQSRSASSRRPRGLSLPGAQPPLRRTALPARDGQHAGTRVDKRAARAAVIRTGRSPSRPR